jgi:hypothetical protein
VTSDRRCTARSIVDAVPTRDEIIIKDPRERSVANKNIDGLEQIKLKASESKPNAILRSAIAGWEEMNPSARNAAYRQLLDSRLFLTKDPAGPGLGTHAYQSTRGGLVLPVFTDAPALEAWVKTWAAEPIVFGTMPGRIVFDGALRMGVDTLAINLAGPRVLLLTRGTVEEALATQ